MFCSLITQRPQQGRTERTRYMAYVHRHWTQIPGDQFKDGRRLRETEDEDALCAFLDQRPTQPQCNHL